MGRQQSCRWCFPSGLGLKKPEIPKTSRAGAGNALKTLSSTWKNKYREIKIGREREQQGKKFLFWGAKHKNHRKIGQRHQGQGVGIFGIFRIYWNIWNIYPFGEKLDELVLPEHEGISTLMVLPLVLVVTWSVNGRTNLKKWYRN